MPTQEEQLGLISDAVLLQTQAVLDLKTGLTDLVNTAVADFILTIARVADLDKVNNTSDINKPISKLTLDALATKQIALVDGVNLSTVNGISLLTGTPLVVQRSATSLVSLSYDARGSLRNPIAPLPALDDSVVIEGIGLLMYINTTLEPDDDETCFTAIDPLSAMPIGQWILKAPSFDLQDAHVQIELSTIKELIDNYLQLTNK